MKHLTRLDPKKKYSPPSLKNQVLMSRESSESTFPNTNRLYKVNNRQCNHDLVALKRLSMCLSCTCIKQHTHNLTRTTLITLFKIT